MQFDDDPAFQSSDRPKDCSHITGDLAEIRERTLDKTIEDSFPASDPAPAVDSFTA
jgi:hypothetical protein